ncbi:hypothetical protein ACSBR2_008238 [Camellia fascicularis]
MEMAVVGELISQLNTTQIVLSNIDDCLKWKALPSAKFLGSLAWKSRIKSSDFLQRIGVISEDTSTLCVLCNCEGESLNHVMLWCPVVWRLWSNIFKWWGFQGVMPGSIKGLLCLWDGFKFKNFYWILGKSIPSALMWSLWKTRNDCVFNGVQPHLDELCDLINIRIILWSKPHYPRYKYTIHELGNNVQRIRSSAL